MRCSLLFGWFCLLSQGFWGLPEKARKGDQGSDLKSQRFEIAAMSVAISVLDFGTDLEVIRLRFCVALCDFKLRFYCDLNRENGSTYLHRAGPLLENGLDRPEHRYGKYGFASFSSSSISTVGVAGARVSV